MSRVAPLLVAGLLVSGCAISREAQVRTALTDAGLPPAFAQCMAEPLARDLSTDQLRSLARIARVARPEGPPLDEQQLLAMLRQSVDPATVSVVVRAGLGCFVRG